MDILWLQNSVSRQFLANTIATLTEQLITINNVVNGLLSDDSATVTNHIDSSNQQQQQQTKQQRCNETLFTKQLINSIRGNVACAHRHNFTGDTDNHQYQSRSAVARPHEHLQSSSQLQKHHQHYHCYEQQQEQLPSSTSTASSPQQQMLHRYSSSSNSSARIMNDIKAIGIIVNLDIEKCGTISTYDCDSNYNSTATETYTTIHRHCDGINKCSGQHDVQNANCNYTKRKNHNKRSTRTTITTSTSPLSIDSINSDSNVCSNFKYNVDSTSSYSNRFNIDSPMINIAPISTANVSSTIHSQFDKHTQISRNQWWKKLVIVICYLFLLSSSLRICSANKHEVSNCTFPQRWEGSWFLSGNQQPIFIKGNTLSFRGKCMASDGDKFLIVDEKGCHRCLVIYEKHKNVLQYKESECEGDNMFMDQSNPAAMSIQQMRSTILKSDHKGGAHPNIRLLSSSDQYSSRSNDDTNDNYYCKGRETLQNLCEQIAGDALLYSLFKENAEPVKCPLRGPFTFTYNRGHGECRNPVSNIESCTEDSRLLLNLQACPDVAGTESTVLSMNFEELTCLATWRDGNSRYLVGLVSHHHAVSNEERYRCFVYEKILSNDESSKDAEYKLAQSGDATCNGLDSAEVGSRIMTLRRSPPTERCYFPAWFKGPQEWRSLTGSKYHQSSDGSMHISKPNGHMETRALCEQINKNTATETQVIVHQTTGCQSGYMCMIFYRRDTHIAEIQMGMPAVRLEDACTVDNFDVMKLPYVTLVASTVEPQECPLVGLYNLRGAIGPPYISSRHKRNHNKGHHHHHEAQYKRYTALSFRNPEEFSNLDWQIRSRVAPLRNRREIRTRRLANGSVIQIAEKHDATTSDSGQVILPTNATTAAKQNSTAVDIQRSKRDTPECVINYNSVRQLYVGCSQSNVIEVKPHCSDDGDEVYNCQGSWTENTTTFIVAKHSGSHHSVCISYQPTEAPNVRLFVGDTCYRSVPLQTSDHHLAANLTVVGKCTDVSSATRAIINWNFLHIMLMFTINALIGSR